MATRYLILTNGVALETRPTSKARALKIAAEYVTVAEALGGAHKVQVQTVATGKIVFEWISVPEHYLNTDTTQATIFTTRDETRRGEYWPVTGTLYAYERSGGRWSEETRQTIAVGPYADSGDVWDAINHAFDSESDADFNIIDVSLYERSQTVEGKIMRALNSEDDRVSGTPEIGALSDDDAKSDAWVASLDRACEASGKSLAAFGEPLADWERELLESATGPEITRHVVGEVNGATFVEIFGSDGTPERIIFVNAAEYRTEVVEIECALWTLVQVFDRGVCTASLTVDATEYRPETPHNRIMAQIAVQTARTVRFTRDAILARAHAAEITLTPEDLRMVDGQFTVDGMDAGTWLDMMLDA